MTGYIPWRMEAKRVKTIDKILFSSSKDDWETPQNLFDRLNDEFHFTLDPASSDYNAKCANHFTIDNDGLKQNWEGEVVYLNPPYGRQSTATWVRKAYEESLKPNTTVVCLIPARTDTKWFHEYILPFAEIRFVKGRIKFGDGKNSAPFPSMLCIFGQQIKPKTLAYKN